MRERRRHGLRSCDANATATADAAAGAAVVAAAAADSGADSRPWQVVGGGQQTQHCWHSRWSMSWTSLHCSQDCGDSRAWRGDIVIDGGSTGEWAAR